MGDATLHRHGDTIPGPDGPPIVPFPRKRAALSAPGGALVLSPLEIPPKERRGSDSGKRSRGRPICNTCVRRTFWCGGRTDLRFEYSAAGRCVSSLVGSAWRPTSVLGELTDKAVNSSLTFFLFHRARRIFFLMSQKENGGCISAAKRRIRTANRCMLLGKRKWRYNFVPHGGTLGRQAPQRVNPHRGSTARG